MKISPIPRGISFRKNPRKARSKRRPSALIGSIAALTLCLAHAAFGANGTWNGTAADGLWNTPGNWTGGLPGSGDTATFDSAGGGFTTISLGLGVTVNAINFNSSAAAAYTIGSGAVNSETLTLNNGGSITMAGSVVQNELFNAAIVLGTDATLATYTFANNSATNLLNFAGTITGGTGGAAALKTLAVGGTGNTLIGGAISDGGAMALALTKSGAGNLTLRGANLYTGTTTVQGGTLTLDANTGAGSIAGAALTFSGGGGTFNYLQAAAGSTQAFSGALTFSAGAGRVQSTFGGGGTGGLTFGSLARSAGAMGNFVVSGGTNGTDNSISFGTVGAGFQNQGLFFNGSSYAFMNSANGFVRGIIYGTDAGTATAGVGATIGALGGQHVQVTGSIGGQTSLAINTLNVAGSNLFLNIGAPAAQTLTLTNAGILKTGGGNAQISGGTLAAAAELVLRADTSTDNLRIGSVISGSGGVTTGGAGTVTLVGINTFTGNIIVNKGTLSITTDLENNPATEGTSPFGAAGARNITLLGGATFQNLGSVAINVKAGTKAFIIGEGGGTFNLNAGATLILDDATQFTGTGDLTVTSGGNGIFTVGNAATPSAFSGNVTINGGTVRIINTASALGTAPNRSLLVNSGGSLDVAIGGFNPGAGTTITLNGNGVNNTGALQLTQTVNSGTANNIVLASNASIGVTGASSLTLSGVISGSASLTKVGAGAGALTLSGLNTYTGNTIVNAGTLVADSVTNAAPISSASALVFSGSGTFRYTGLAATTRSMTLNGLTLAGGAGIVDANNIGTATTLTLGTIARPTGGGSVDFRATTGTFGTTALVNFAGGSLVNGILGGYATVASGANLATLDGSNNVVAYGAYTNINTNGSVIPSAAANNVRIQTVFGAGNITISAGTTDVNTIFQNTATAVTVDTAAGILRLGSQGGIISSPTAAATGTVTIGTAANSGTLTAGGAANAAGEIIVNTATANTVTINSVIADNGSGAVALNLTGLAGGTLSLGGTNTYSGVTTITTGTLQINAALGNINTAGALGKGSIAGSAADLVLNGGTLQLTVNAPTTTDRLFSVGLGNGTLSNSNGNVAHTLSLTGTGAIGFNGQSGSRTLTLTGTNTGGNLLAAVLGDSGGPSHLTKTAAGTWILAGNNAYTGTTTVSGGILQVGNGGTVGSLGSGYIAGTGGTIAFAHSDNVTLNNLIAGGAIRQTTATTLNLNNAASSVTTLQFNGVDGGIIDLLADVATNNLGGSSILATNSGTINASGGGRLIINSTAGATNGQDWGAANGKTLTINAVIANGTANNVDIYQSGGGTGVTILTADNTFTGLNIQGNTLQVARIGNQGTAAPVGAGTTIGISGTGGTGLKYTGTGEVTDRIISLIGTTTGGFIEQAGLSGLLKFTANFATPGAGVKVLTLQGSTLGTGEISGVISDASANVNTTGVTKAGTGTWTLSGANTYTGPTIVNGGALIIGAANAVQNSPISSTVANSATSGLVFAAGIGSFSIGGLAGALALDLSDSAATPLTALTIGGTNTATSTFSGVLSGSTPITKTGPSTQAFTGVNTYTGKITVTGGILALNAETGLGPNPGALTPDQLTLNGGAIGAVANSLFTIDDANRGITIGALGGTFDAQGGSVMTIAVPIAGGTNAVTKTGPGVVIFSAPNGYGDTTITGGRLLVVGAGTLGSGTLTLNGGALDVSGATPSAVTVGPAASGSSLIYNPGVTTDLSAGLTLTAGGNLPVDVVSSTTTVVYASAFGSSTTAGLTKAGAGTLTLRGGTTGNTFTGTTTAGAGTLLLDFTTVNAPASGVIASASPLTLRGGTLSLLGFTGTTDLQTFASTALLEGGSTITAAQGGAASVGASLGLISRDGTTNRGTVNFVLPTTGSYATTSVNNSSGILGGWATVGGTNWATVTAGAIASYTGDAAADLSVTGGVTTTNYRVNAATTLTGNVAANALRFTTTGLTLALGTNNLTMSGNSGGILQPLAAGTISGTTTNTGTGFINAGAAGELVIYNTGTLTIGAGIGGTITGFGVTKSGGGTLTLNNAGTTANNFTGGVTVNGGTLIIDAANRIGTGGVTLNGGQLNISFGTSAGFTPAYTLGLSGGSINYTTGGNNNISNTGAMTLLGRGSRTLTFLGVTDRVGIFQHTIADSGGPTALVFNGASNTTITQLSGSSTFTGSTTITRGVVRLNAANALSVASNVTFNGGANRAILEYNTAGGTSFTNALGTLPGQVQWLGNGGFSSSSLNATLTVNLGGNAVPSTVTWASGGFVPNGSALQFAQASANSNYGSGTVDFRNPIDLASAARTVDVADNGIQSEAILSGLISGAAGSVLTKTGTGVLTLTADNSSSANVGLTVTGGTVVLPNVNALPGTVGTTVTINVAGSLVLTGSANPLATIGARIAPASAGAIALDTSSSAALDFSTFSGLALGAYNPTIGQAVVFTGSITPFTDNVYRLGLGRAAVNTAAVTGNTLINFAANAASNVLVLPVANQLRDAGAARSLVVGAGAPYLTSYNTFTGGTKAGTITGQTGNTNLGIGNDAALGSGLVQFSPTGTTAGTGFIGAVNGDHILSNNVTVAALGNWVASADLASDGIANAGAMTFAGKTTLTGAVNIFSRSRLAIFTGDIAATGAISINAGGVSFLATPAGAANKIFAQNTSIAIGQSLTIDSNASLGSGTNTLTIGTGTVAVTNTFLRIQPGTVSDVVLTGRAVVVGANFQPVFDVPGGPVTGVTSNLVIPGVTSGAGTTQILKIGHGTLTLRGANTWTSIAANGLQIFGGSVVVDVANSATARVTNATTMALTLGTSGAATAATYGGGGTFTLSAGTNPGAQTFTILQAAAKDNALNLSATGGGSAALTFNGVTFNRTATGGALAIGTSGTTSITLSGAIAANTGASVAGAIVLDAGATGNAFATINGTDWAARNGANQIVPLGSAGAGSYTLSTAGALSGNADMDATVPTTTLAGPTTVTSLRFNAAAAETVNLIASNLVTGGILVGTGAGAFAQTISTSGAGALQGIASKDLIVINAAPVDTAVLTISAPIIDNTAATALTKSGPGTVVLSGNNAFTGSIFLNGGVLSVATAGTAAAANPLGQMASGATNLIMNGGTLRYTGAGSTTTDRGATFNSFSKIEVTNPAGTLVETGAMFGFGGTTALSITGLLNKTGPGTLSLSGALDNVSLTAMVTAGTLNLDKASTAGVHALAGGGGTAALIVNGGTARITGSGGDQIFNPSSVVVNGSGVLDFNGQSETFDTLAGTGTVTNTGANGVPITLTLGDATIAGAQTLTGPNTPNAAAAGVAATGLNFFSGNITDNGTNKLALTKAGPGSQTLAGTGNTFSGDTTVTSGTIRLGAANVLPSGPGKGNVILTGNTVIFGLTVPGVLDMGGFNQAINGLTGSAGSIVTNTPSIAAGADQTNTIIVGLNDQTAAFDGVFQDGYSVQPGVAPVGHFGFLAVDKVGAGVLTLTGANTNTGAVTVDGGRIDLNNATGNALATNVTINTGGTLRLLAGNQIADAKTVTTSGGTFDLNGKNETVGVLLTSGSIVDAAGTGSLSSGSAFDLQSGLVTAKLSGTSGLNKTTGGTVTLGGAQVHNFSGATNVSAGTLVLASGASLSASTGVNLTGTSKLFVNGSTATLIPVSVDTGATLGGSGTVNGTVSVASGGTIEAGQSGSGSLSVGAINFSGPATINLFNLNSLTASILNVATALSTTAGAGNVVTINLTNSGSLDGTTNYTANGYKLIDVPASFAFGPNTNFALGTVTGVGGRSSATLNPVDTDALYLLVNVVNPVWSGALSSEWSAAILAGPKNWYLPPSLANITDYIDLPNPDTVIFNDTATGSTTVDISMGDVHPNGVTFSFGSTIPNYTLQGSRKISGSTNLVKSGTGTLTINNTNDFTGGVVINGGVIKLGTSTALGTQNTLTFGASAAAGTKLQLFGNNATFTGLSTNATSGSPVVENGDTIADSVLTVNLASGANTYAGVLQNGATKKLGLVKQGGGTLILTGTNTADGGNTVSVGTLQIGSGGTSGVLAGSTSVAGGAVLDFNRSDASPYAGGVTGAGMVSVEGGGTLSITGDVAHSGGTTITPLSTLQIGAGGATGDLGGAGNITDNGTLAFNRTGSATVQAPINGTGNVVAGDGVTVGTLILTGNNGYQGATTISANATLQIGNGAASGSLGTAASITDNGTFAYARTDAQTYGTVFNGTGALHILSGTLTLTGNNNASYSGGTTIDSGAALIVGNVAGTAGAIPGFNAAGTGNIVADGSVTFRRTGANTFDNVISGGAAGNVTVAAGSWTFPNLTPYFGTTGILSGATLNIAASAGSGIGPNAIADAGTLVFNRATPYTLTSGNLVTGTGAVNLINSGAVIAAVDGQFNVSGPLVLGASAGTIVSTLDLTNGSSTFGGLTVQTNTATPNVILLGPGKILTNTGNVVIGVNTAVGQSTALNVVGSTGSWQITNPAAAGTFQVGGATGATNTNAVVADLTGLGTFNANLTGATSAFRVGSLNSTSAMITTTLRLAPTSTITAATVGIGDNTGEGGGAAGAKILSLGTGANTINANTINIGEVTGNRGSGLMSFQSPTLGTLSIRSQSGASGTANLTMVNNASGTATTLDGKLLLAGHNVDVSLNSVIMSARSAATTNGSDAQITFDTGTFTANSIAMVARTGSAFTTGASTGTITIGGGNASLGAVTMAVNTVTNSTAAPGAATANLNISGGTVSAASINMANAVVTGVVKTATANLNLTGGTFTLGGNITRTNGGGTENATVMLNGSAAALDLGGNSIGSAAAPIAFTLSQGTLRNLAEFNGGANLVKTTAGTATLAGSNSYTGATNINAGTVNIDSLAAGAASQSLGKNILANAVTLGVAATSSGRLNYTGAAGALDKNITALGNGADTVQNSGSGLLTLSGTLTKNGTTLTLNGGANGIAVTGQIVGGAPNSDLTVSGGATTLSNNNSYTGATTVTSTGALAIVTGGSLSGTTGMTVNSGGALLVNNNVSNVINATTPAPLAVNGGTFALGPTVSADTTKTQTFAALTLSGASTVDFGTGAQGSALVFAPNASFASGSLKIFNWSQGTYAFGTPDTGALNDTQDRFLFDGTGSGLSGTQLANIQFYSDAGVNLIGSASEVPFGSQFEIVPVPEPATGALLGSFALCTLLGVRRRKK